MSSSTIEIIFLIHNNYGTLKKNFQSIVQNLTLVRIAAWFNYGVMKWREKVLKMFG